MSAIYSANLCKLPLDSDSELGALLLNGPLLWTGPGAPSIGGISEKIAGVGDILYPKRK